MDNRCIALIEERMSQTKTLPPVVSVALLGNYLPRQCGIAVFTVDLTEALSSSGLDLRCEVIAMNDAGNNYSYGEKVRFEIRESDLASYRRAGDFLNVGGFDVLCLQHEFGIFGGKCGAHILDTLNRCTIPVVTTLHTVLENPTRHERRVMDEIVKLSTRVVVMSHHSAELLRRQHVVSADKIDVIPHGIPSIPGREESRRRLRIDDGFQLLTFGLLSPDKGLEYVIDALPAVLKKHPKTTYMIVGATHPHVRVNHGETYRRSLQLRARNLGVQNHVVFHDRFVSAAELGEFLAATDIYLTPYLNKEQSTSGTLAYAVGTGQVVISTPYRYAEELLSDGRGVLVPARDSESISQSLISLLDSPEERQKVSERATAFGRKMTWPSVAALYKKSFVRAAEEAKNRLASEGMKSPFGEPQVELPELSLRHIKTMTDGTGLLQHAIYSVPRYEDGYSIDDNARALLLMTRIEEGCTDDRDTTRVLSSKYLAFLSHAFNEKNSRFRNFMTYSRNFTEEAGSEDSHGRTLWALGTEASRGNEAGRRGLATQLFRQALPVTRTFTSPRALAFVLLGACEYLRAFGDDREVAALQGEVAEQLLARFPQNYSQPWPWCEDALTYENARLPQALIVTGQCLNNQEMKQSGLDALEWLTTVQQTPNGAFAPVGSNGFYRKGEPMAEFDQQPVEAWATISACLDAWRFTGKKLWSTEMWRAFGWFLGENDSKTPLYDPVTHGCRDGLHADRPNENQGAESTLSFLLALLDMQALAAESRLRHTERPPDIQPAAVRIPAA